MSDSFIDTSKCVVRVWVVCNSSIRRFTGACACNDTAKGIYIIYTSLLTLIQAYTSILL